MFLDKEVPNRIVIGGGVLVDNKDEITELTDLLQQFVGTTLVQQVPRNKSNVHN